MSDRIQISTGVSERTRQQVDELIRQRGYSLRDVVTIAVDRFYKQEVAMEQVSATKRIHCDARGDQSTYDAVEERFGDDHWHIRHVECSPSWHPYRPPEGYVIIGTTTAHAQSGPWFVLMAPADMANAILERHRGTISAG